MRRRVADFGIPRACEVCTVDGTGRRPGFHGEVREALTTMSHAFPYELKLRARGALFSWGDVISFSFHACRSLEEARRVVGDERVIVVLEPRASLQVRYPEAREWGNLSVTDMRARESFLDADRYGGLDPAADERLRGGRYARYLINHEVGHALGLRHPRSLVRMRLFGPVMHQHTRERLSTKPLTSPSVFDLLLT